MRSSNKIFHLCCIFLLAVLLVGACSPASHEHPVVGVTDTSAIEILAQTPAHTVLSEQSVVRFGDVIQSDTIRMNGIIVPDERRTNKIAARISGRVEKLYVRFPYQYVSKGDKLLDLYSEELNTAISEYIFLWRKDSASTLTAQSRQKLLLWGLMNFQLEEFKKTGIARSTISLYSPYSGYVVQLGSSNTSVGATTNSGDMGNMSGIGSSNPKPKSGPTPTTSASLREGVYVNAGQTLFALNDAKEVIALFSLTSADQVSVKEGTSVGVRSELLPGRLLTGTVDLVESSFETGGQRFLSARVKLENSSGALKFNSLAEGEIIHADTNINLLPSSCVFDLGQRKIVWVKSGVAGGIPIFTTRVVVTGIGNAISTEIISGLKPGEEVALEAGLLTDREGIIQTELQ